MQTDVHLLVRYETEHFRSTARLACIPWTWVAGAFANIEQRLIIAPALCVVNQRVAVAEVLAVENAFILAVVLELDAECDSAHLVVVKTDAFVLVVHIHNSLNDFDTRDVAWLRLAPAVFRKCVHKRVVILLYFVDVPAFVRAAAVA